MSHINVEMKARTSDAAKIRNWLLAEGAEFKGIDRQVDTYFQSREGRLKLREGNIENNLIYYDRGNESGPKQSDFTLMAVTEPGPLKSILASAMGIKVVVAKKREIYFIANVKFHIDELEGLGNFVEIEASNKTHAVALEELHRQCRHYMDAFEIREEDLIDRSYSDMLLENKEAREKVAFK